MLKILIIDDNIQKINVIIEELKDLCDGNCVSIDYEMEIKKACKSLEEKYYDLVILDVQLPSLGRGEMVTKNGGIELLQMIDGLDRIKKPNFVIGLTSFDDDYQSMVEKFGDFLWILLKYSSNEVDWKNKIRKKIEYMIESKKIGILERIKGEVVDVAIITAVDVELQSVLSYSKNWQKFEYGDDSTIYYISQIEKEGRNIKVVVAMQNQMGMVSATTLTSKLICRYSPRVVVMLGITGGREGEVELGDLIVASDAWDYGSGKIKPSNTGTSFILEPEPHAIPIDSTIKEFMLADFSDLLYSIRKTWNSSNGNKQMTDISIHVGPLASGAAVIQDETIMTEFIQPQNRKVLGVDMETYAVYYAAVNTNRIATKYVSIKTVCDFANKHKKNDYQRYSAYVSTNFFFEIMHDLVDRIKI